MWDRNPIFSAPVDCDDLHNASVPGVSFFLRYFDDPFHFDDLPLSADLPNFADFSQTNWPSLSFPRTFPMILSASFQQFAIIHLEIKNEILDQWIL